MGSNRCQNKPGSNGNKGVFQITQNSRTGSSPSDGLEVVLLLGGDAVVLVNHPKQLECPGFE